jgi:hypothetical protein
MRVTLDFSIFIRDGAAFGMATHQVDVVRVPGIGEQIPWSGFELPDVDVLEGYPLVVDALQAIDHGMIAMARDVVVASIPDAWRLVSVLEDAGAFCDIWGWTKYKNSWQKDQG